MNFSQDILTVLLISIFAQSAGTELSTNSNYLLLLLLALSSSGNSCGCNNCGCNNCCTNPCSSCGSCNSCGGRLF